MVVASALDVSVQVGAVRLKNPILAASGTFGYGIEFAHLVDLNELGGIVVKGLSLEPMEGAPAPRLCETAGGMINAVGLQNIGVRAFVTEKLPQLRKYDTAIVANIFGHSVEEYPRVAEALEEAEGLAACELNISCPNTSRGGMQFGGAPDSAAEVVAAVRKVTKRPLWVKLSPLVTDIAAIARAVEAAGADALTVANTYPAVCVDIQTRRSRLGSLTGGLSGPAIKPMTQRQVLEVARAVRLPILGLGGIETVVDVVEYIILGATAVQVGTANFVDPVACTALVRKLTDSLVQLNVNSLNDLRGSFYTDLIAKRGPAGV